MVTCNVCQCQFRAITRSHLAKHQLTYAAYLCLYPNADLGRKQRLLITSDEAQRLYEEQRLSINAIAISKGVHPELIRRDLIYLGYEVRGHKANRYVCDYDPTGHEQLEALAIGIWMGEGSKGGKRLEVTNCSPTILKIWLKFLLVVCRVDSEKIRLRIHIHDRDLQNESEVYWQQQLGMSLSSTFSVKYAKPVAESERRQTMGTVAMYINSTFLQETIQRRAVELATSLM